jgi:hypothetical protein
MMNHRPDQHGVWFDYDGCRYKDHYDIRLKTGEVIQDCRPNADAWYPNSSKEKRVFRDRDVAQIRLKPDDELDRSWYLTGEERVNHQIKLFGPAVPDEPQPPSERQVW